MRSLEWPGPAGNSHTCALRADGRVLCWGEGRYGAAGVPFHCDASPQIDAPGRHALRVAARDLAGNEAVADLEVVIAPASPAPP